MFQNKTYVCSDFSMYDTCNEFISLCDLAPCKDTVSWGNFFTQKNGRRKKIGGVTRTLSLWLTLWRGRALGPHFRVLFESLSSHLGTLWNGTLLSHHGLILWFQFHFSGRIPCTERFELEEKVGLVLSIPQKTKKNRCVLKRWTANRKFCSRPSGQKLNTNFLFSNFSGDFGISRPKFRDLPPKKFGFPAFEGHTWAFWPPPDHVFDPHPTKGYPNKKCLGLGSFFLPQKIQNHVPCSFAPKYKNHVLGGAQRKNRSVPAFSKSQRSVLGTRNFIVCQNFWFLKFLVKAWGWGIFALIL